MIQEKEKQSQAETQEQGENWMQIAFAAQSENEGFARTAVAAFVSCLDPTIDELADIKTAVSEAVTNCIIHGYNLKGGTIWQACQDGRCMWRLRTRDAESETSNRRWNHCLRHDRIWNVPAWDFLLWKPLWMLWKWNLLQEKGDGLS